VHLLEASAVRLDIDELRRKNTECCGGGENIANSLNALGPPLERWRHVPDDSALRVKISSDDQQAPPF